MTDPKATPTPQAQAGDGMASAPKDRVILLRLPEIGAWASCWWLGRWSHVSKEWQIAMPPTPESHQQVYVSGYEPTAWADIPGRDTPQAPARDAGAVALNAVAWRVEFQKQGATYAELCWTNPTDRKRDRMESEGATEIISRPLIYGDTHPAAASDDAREAARWRKLEELVDTHHEQYWYINPGDGNPWAGDRLKGERQLRLAIDAALSSPDGLRKGEG